MKLSCWPGVTAKYSGKFAGMNRAELLAVTVAVVSRVAQIESVDAIRTCLVWVPKLVVVCEALVCAVAI
jgi:hypothetical protein